MVSKQRRWQLNKIAQGLCAKCGKPAVNSRKGTLSNFCEYHLNQKRMYQRKLKQGGQ